MLDSDIDVMIELEELTPTFYDKVFDMVFDINYGMVSSYQRFSLGVKSWKRGQCPHRRYLKGDRAGWRVPVTEIDWAAYRLIQAAVTLDSSCLQKTSGSGMLSCFNSRIRSQLDFIFHKFFSNFFTTGLTIGLF